MEILIFRLLFAHWVADFVCQTNYMAQGKSKSIWILSYHILAYSCIFTLLAPAEVNWSYLLFNFLAHWIVDLVTSRVTSKLWEMKQVHWFFTVIGFDQLLHTALLLCTLRFFL